MSWSGWTHRIFCRDSRGSLPVMLAVLLVPMTLMAGGAIDLVRHESTRVELQDALDRGVLAAASLNQTENAETLVRSYLSIVPGGAGAQLTVSDQKTLNTRAVNATAVIQYQPAFLRLAGIRAMTIAATSAAQQARTNIELSMVLDISGSMYDNGGMNQLKPAAKDFLDVVLKDDLRDVTSVSLVPFAGEVNLGYGAFNYISGYLPADPSAAAQAAAASSGTCAPSAASSYKRRHCYSSCFEMQATDFAAGMPNFALRDQVPHFSVYNMTATGKKPWWCPVDAAAVTYVSNDLTYLKSRIDALDPYDGTGTAYGMKWGELLLNPAMRPTIAGLGNKSIAAIPSQFRNRPADFSDKNTMKILVLMTDGKIGLQPRPVDPATNAVTDKNVTGSASRTVYTETQAAGFYKTVCDYAKTEGITIFTIAFKVDAATAKTIAECASDPSYAYKVDGLDMASAFQSIATSMQKIRLVQ
ncbi:pilus assembly protein [Aurantimonas sp. MSK8Z-1]|uniref:TadE/TadG family type IV pilus assembly protein n=1 Tax=Mangrovibrevibacter kandeliae TaxID=2968473 RepID=UPI00211905C6|nr:TadE/TadG family type IV pilus assembly protein [Aurantimonas sp. MSK8Z-1]MCW4115304.1 pilus assembly protein [Aurantimonas sp. MSK8Z-1]